MKTELDLFAKRLKYLRKERKLTLEKFAELVEISPNHISKLEAARTNPSFQLLVRISKALDIEMEDLFNFDEKQTPDYIKSRLTKLIKTSDIKRLQMLPKIYDDITN